jgi:hypothetical protein
MRHLIAVAVVLGVSGAWLAASRAADDDAEEPKFTVKQVMQLHKDKLHEKFQDGSASEEDKKKLLEGYEALTKNKPPKGAEDSWKEKTEALLKAVKDDDVEAYKKAVNCGACHSAHKPA